MTNLSSALKLAPIATLLLAATGWWIGCNQHPVEYSRASGAVEHSRILSGGGKAEMDILWVIDNSGSMCEEQEALRQNFRTFIETLRDTPLNFNMSVTTTDYEAPFEVVSPKGKLGHIQSTPHPPVGFDPQCQQDESKADKYAPLRNQIRAAVECTENPENFSHLNNLTDDQIKCALEADNASDACNRAGWNPGDKSPEQLFPCGDKHGERCKTIDKLRDVYRDIPPVLNAPDYETSSGALDVDELKQDFACMSYVGTRGDSKEQGLRAAVEAVSPENTGGTVENPLDDQGGQSAPNHGFLRDDADTAVIFVTDENDCSHPEDKDVFEEFGCGEMGCYYPTQAGRENQDPLHSTEELAQMFKDNLAASKGKKEVSEDSIVMASIHGTYKPYGSRDGQDEVKNCGSQQQTLRKAANVCQTDLGAATSGDRYEDFLREFDRIFPERAEGGGNLTGWMCKGNFGRALEQLAKQIRPPDQGCIREEVIPCERNEQCPDYRWGEPRPGNICQQWGSNANRNFCRSAMQVRISYANRDAPQDEVEQELNKLGICYGESIGSRATPRGCVVHRDQYEWIGCPGAETSAVTLDWLDSSEITQPAQQLADFNLEIRYSELSGERENDDNGQN